MSLRIPCTFSTYGYHERGILAEAIESLEIARVLDEKRVRAITPPLEEAWLVGGFKDILGKVDEVTRNTREIGRRFVRGGDGQGAAAKAFYWTVEHPDSQLHSVLDIGLNLVPGDPSKGNIVLAQVVLRTGDDKFVYWGVD